MVVNSGGNSLVLEVQEYAEGTCDHSGRFPCKLRPWGNVSIYTFSKGVKNEKDFGNYFMCYNYRKCKS